jgi:glutamate carboxypeptidase
LIGHHDTVFPPGTFEAWDLSGDRLRGPGVLDMKGGLLVVRAAMAALSKAGLLACLPIAIMSVADEEIGSTHSGPILAELARGARAALVFESGRADDSIVTQRKGLGSFNIKVAGKAAHAGNNHEDGKNAIWAMARMVEVLQSQTNYDRGITVNVGTIHGGETRNTVPAYCECGVDYRYTRAVDGKSLIEIVRREAKRIGDELGTAVVVEGGIHRPPLERTADSASLFETYAAIAKQVGLGHGEAALQGGGSDANNVGALGVACIDGLGPRGKGFHTHDEYIDVTTLVPRAQALIMTLFSMFGDAINAAR